MTSIVEIGNIALDHLGEPVITSLDDNVKTARIINRRYPQIRDATLRAHPWNCAEARALLSSADPPPEWGLELSYPVPSDWLRTLRVGESDTNTPRTERNWRMEGRRIVTNIAAPLPIVYTRRLEDANLFDALLVEAIGARLAWVMALPLTRSRSKQQAMERLYRSTVKEARTIDSREGRPPPVSDERLLQTRVSGIQAPFGRNPNA